MTAAPGILDRLHAFGFAVEADPPGLVVRYLHGSEPPLDALPLLDELRDHKEEVLVALMTPQPWDDAVERGRLNAAFDWADAEPRRRRVVWTDAWGATPPEIRPFLDEALDRLDAAWRARDVLAHCAALDDFRRVVAVVLDVYQLPAAIRAANEPVSIDAPDPR